MKIAYFELKFGDFYEDYSINPKGYGGGPVFARWAKELLNDEQNEFILFAPEKCLENVSDKERKDKCVGLPDSVIKAIRLKIPIDQLISGLEIFDLIVHHHTCETINMGNLKMPQVHWSGFGRGDAGHPNNNYTLLYTPGEKSCFGEKYKYIKIGKPVPKVFVKNLNKCHPFAGSNYIFQCSRHDESMNTIEVAQDCIKYGIKGIFAGPINDGYKLMDYIDNKNTFYVGKISEEEKIEFTKHAILTTYYHKWQTVFNQSVIESWSLGTPIIANSVGFFKQVLKHGINGYIHDDESQSLNPRTTLEQAFRFAKNINQEDCWLSAKEFSVEEMIASFKKAFEEIIKEWKK